MAVRKLDLATRKEMLARISQEKRTPKKESQKDCTTDHSWKPLVLSGSSSSPYLCHCRDVRRGLANVCPAHMLAFHLAESVH